MNIDVLKLEIKNITKGKNKLHKEYTKKKYYQNNNLLHVYHNIINENKKRGFDSNVDLKQCIYNILNDVYERPKCVVCNEKEVYFACFKDGYRLTCSQKCRNVHLNILSVKNKKIKMSKFNELTSAILKFENTKQKHSNEFLKKYINKNIGRYYMEDDYSIIESMIARTFYLNIHDSSIKERIYNIRTDIYDVLYCPICNERKRKFITHKYQITCGNSKCIKAYRSIINSNIKQTKESRQLAINSRKNNGKPWHTKEALKKISISNKKFWSENKEYKQEIVNKVDYKSISKKIKDKIRKGEYTPIITNSWTNNKKIYLEDFNTYYRSTWEAVFQLLNVDCVYETQRIKYKDTYNIDKVYIADFIDKTNKILYEIKPQSLLVHNKRKIEAATKWCENNKFSFKIITEKYFIDNQNTIRGLIHKNDTLKNGMRYLFCIK